jgi:tricorn protease-like protein
MSAIHQKYSWLLTQISQRPFNNYKYIQYIYRNINPNDPIRARLTNGTVVAAHHPSSLVGMSLQGYTQPTVYEEKGALDTQVKGLYFQATHNLPPASHIVHFACSFQFRKFLGPLNRSSFWMLTQRY